MSNSSLVTYTKISPNRTNGRTHIIDTVTIHCMAGNLSIETCGSLFSRTTTRASSNYGIGSDGRIGLYVEEKDRSWATSSSANDNRAITIEVASESVHPYKITDKAYKSLINLLTDICKRNNIKKLVWSTNRNDRVNHLNGCNMTAHRDYANKACPGDYIYNLEGQIAKEVNEKLNGKSSNTTPSNNSNMYRVRKSWKNSASQLGAYYSLSSAKAIAKKNKGYKVFNKDGKQVYPTMKTYSGGFPIVPPNLKMNSSGLQVQRLQKFLNWYGNSLAVDGKFGNKTYLAVVEFQKKNGLTADGIFGSASLAKAKKIKK